MGNRGPNAHKKAVENGKKGGRPRKKASADVIAGARKLAPLALRRLRELLRSPDLDPALRLRAARIVTDLAAKVPEEPAATADSEWRVKFVPHWRAPGKEGVTPSDHDSD